MSTFFILLKELRSWALEYEYVRLSVNAVLSDPVCVGWVRLNGQSLTESSRASRYCTASGTSLELWRCRVNHLSILISYLLVIIETLYLLSWLWSPGAGPHPKALAGRVVSSIWWLFAVLLLACYFANFYSMLHSDKKHSSISTFSDLANQDLIEYGTVEGGSTTQFFKVLSTNSNLNTFLNKDANQILFKYLNTQSIVNTSYLHHSRKIVYDEFGIGNRIGPLWNHFLL